MSRGKGHSVRARRGDSQGTRRRRGPIWLIAVLGMILAAWWFWRRYDAPALPEIPTAQFDATSARLVQQHLEVVRSTPRSATAWGRLGALLRSFELRAEARRCFSVAAQLDSTDARWPYFLGLMLVVESPTEAIVKLQRAVVLCGNEPETPRLRLARLLAESGRADESAQELRELLRAKPDYAPANLALAQLALARNDLTNAVSLASRCTSDRRTARASWTLLSALHLRLGNTNDALTARQRAAALPPDAAIADSFEAGLLAVRADARDLSDRAQRFLMAGQLQEAEPLIDQLIREHSQFAEGWLLLGRLQILNRQPAAAEQSLRRHLQWDAESINGHFQLGMALLAQERFADAAEILRKATQLKADFGAAWFHLGMALARAGRHQEAVAPFREAMRHNPERVDSYILLGDLLLQLGQKSAAAELARQAELVSPNDRRLATLREKLAQTP